MLSAPAFATDDPDGPQVTKTSQLTFAPECPDPDFKLKGEKGQHVVISGKAGPVLDETGPDSVGTEPGECAPPEKVKCVAGPVKLREGGHWQVRLRDEKGSLRKHNFKYKKDAVYFTQKQKHTVKFIGCSFLR